MSSFLTSISLFTALLLLTQPLSSDNYPEEDGCAGAARYTGGVWLMPSSMCLGSGCSVHTVGDLKWCGPNGAEQACCHTGLVMNAEGDWFPEARGDCQSCTGGGVDCILKTKTQDGYEVEGAICTS